MDIMTRPTYDLDGARRMADALSGACGVCCRLVDGEGVEAYRSATAPDGCARCRAALDVSSDCGAAHAEGARQAERFGGRYIYFCPGGMAWCAAPVMAGGRAVVSLVCGPAMLMDLDDYLAGTPLAARPMSLGELRRASAALEAVPRKQPAEFSHISSLLLAAAAFAGDGGGALREVREAQAQEQDIGAHIQQLKLRGDMPVYPLEKERELLRCITEGDQRTARQLLNELLGYILFATGGDFSTMRARSLELMALLSRAAADGGADLAQVFELNRRFLEESDHLASSRELTAWLNRVIEQYAALVFDLVDVKHKDTIYKALSYLKQNFTRKLTLEETAAHVGFSAAYFSRVFRQELGMPWGEYLSRLRIEHSMALLRGTDLPVGEICQRAGFEDQSYFIKVFRRYAGMTPGRYRKAQGRPAHEAERETE